MNTDWFTVERLIHKLTKLVAFKCALEIFRRNGGHKNRIGQKLIILVDLHVFHRKIVLRYYLKNLDAKCLI